MQGLTDFWRRGFIAKLITIGAAVGVLSVGCCVLLLALAVLVPTPAQQARPAIAPTAQMLVAADAPALAEAPRPTNTPAPTGTPAPTATPAPTSTPGPQSVTLPRQMLKVYKGPGRWYPLAHILDTRHVTVLAVRDMDGTRWYHIQDGAVDGWAVLPSLDPALIAMLPIDTSEIQPPPMTPTPRPTETREPLPDVGVRVGAICRDGTRSNATGRGACSHHGGVDHWLYR